MYYDTGKTQVLTPEKNSAVFIVRDFPQMTLQLRAAMRGHLTHLIESTGAKNVRVMQDSTDPNAWAWKIYWG